MCEGDEVKLHTFLTLEVSGHILDALPLGRNRSVGKFQNQP